MKIIAVDNNPEELDGITDVLRQTPGGGFCAGFHSAKNALEYTRENPADVAVLAAECCAECGYTLGRQLQELHPRINLIYLADSGEQALHAMSVRASGYIIRPFSRDKILAELENLRYPVVKSPRNTRVFAQCFGNFELFVDGKPAAFRYSKTRELAAYLINKKGASCTHGELCAVLWEDRPDTASLRSYLRDLISDLAAVLRAAGSEAILLRRRGAVSVDWTGIASDYSAWLRGEPFGNYIFRGEFMNQYSWAEFTRGRLENPNL